MDQLDKEYWTKRYEEHETGWDAGSITTPLKEYIDQLTDKNISILIPGAGNAHEAEYLFKNGFKNVFVIDISEEPLKNFKNRVPEFPSQNLLFEDFFEHSGKYDLIIEQTFFCAIDPTLRKKYADKMFDLLKPKGKLVGLLFNDKLNNDQPPFGGNKEEYIKYFGKHFKFKTFDPCYNSIKPREERELFINFVRK
jgi:methyl halide transferase